MHYNFKRTVVRKKRPIPAFPFVWIWNDISRRECRRLCEEAKVRFEMGPHQDGSGYEMGLYIHGEDLDKFWDYLKKRGMYAEKEWVKEARARFHTMQAQQE